VLHVLPPYTELQVQLQDGCRPLTEDAWLLQFAALVHGGMALQVGQFWYPEAHDWQALPVNPT
jgi:hypothetical protein